MVSPFSGTALDIQGVYSWSYLDFLVAQSSFFVPDFEPGQSIGGGLQRLKPAG